MRIDRDGPELDRCENPASVGEPDGVFSDEDELPDGGVESLDEVPTGGVYGMEAPLRGVVAVEAAAESVERTAAPGASLSEVDELLDDVLDDVPS